MFNKMKSKLALMGTTVTVTIISTSANAAVDVANIVTEITSNQAAVAQVGGAVLLLVVGAAVFKYIRRAL